MKSQFIALLFLCSSLWSVHGPHNNVVRIGAAGPVSLCITSPISNQQKEENDDRCPICFENLNEQQETIKLLCGHTYCKQCIDDHVALRGEYKAMCPLCNARIHVPPVPPVVEWYQNHKKWVLGTIFSLVGFGLMLS